MWAITPGACKRAALRIGFHIKCYIIISVTATVKRIGDSLEVLSGFPDEVKLTMGFNVRRLQEGRPLICSVRPMPSIGKGVFELKDQDDAGWYRLIYLARVEDTIYVLHCFKKNTAKTTKSDLNAAEARLKLVNQRILQEKKARKA